MNGKPLTMNSAWKTYDKLFKDDRVSFMPEDTEVDRYFRRYTSDSAPSPKVWVDSWLLAMAASRGGMVVTLDARLSERSKLYEEQRCVLLT